MTTCTLCSRYGLTTEATETRRIESEYSSSTHAAPVCTECAEQVDRDASRQRQAASLGGLRIKADLEVL